MNGWFKFLFHFVAKKGPNLDKRRVTTHPFKLLSIDYLWEFHYDFRKKMKTSLVRLLLLLWSLRRSGIFQRERQNLEDMPGTLCTTSLAPLSVQLHQQLPSFLKLALSLSLSQDISLSRYLSIKISLSRDIFQALSLDLFHSIPLSLTLPLSLSFLPNLSLSTSLSISSSVNLSQSVSQSLSLNLWCHVLGLGLALLDMSPGVRLGLVRADVRGQGWTLLRWTSGCVLGLFLAD